MDLILDVFLFFWFDPNILGNKMEIFHYNKHTKIKCLDFFQLKNTNKPPAKSSGKL